jgi:hypothetical protein
MSVSFLAWPIIISIILVIWLAVGYKITTKDPKKGFWFLCLYMLISTHSCVVTSVDRSATPNYNEFKFDTFLKTNQNLSFEFQLIELNQEQYIRVRPHTNNPILYMSYNLYRLILLNSWVPEYIYDIHGNLVDWTTDNHDDGRYQDKWDHSKEIKTLSRKEIVAMSKNM